MSRPGPSAEAVGRQLSRCLQNRDAACVAGLVDTRSRDAYGLSHGELVSFIDQYVFQGVTGPEGDPIVRRSPVADSVDVEVNLKTGNGVVTMFMTVGPTQDGIRVRDGATALVVCRMPPKKDFKTPFIRMTSWITRDRAKLESLGIKGLDRLPEGRFMTWDELYAHYSSSPPDVNPKPADNREP
jgi:hypothetical protein